MKPYYADNLATIYCGDGREILPSLPKPAVVITDPPYGINHPTDYKARGRGKLAECSNYPPVHDDDKPFDPQWLLNLNVPLCLWGANHYASRLPDSSGWIIWDKERPDLLDQATCELAWTNFVKGVRRFRHLWNGAMRASYEILVHPTQKPLALMEWVLSLPWTPEGLVADPYMGSASVIVAAKLAGRKTIGIEIVEAYCEIAARRLEVVQPALFTTPTKERQEQSSCFQ